MDWGLTASMDWWKFALMALTAGVAWSAGCAIGAHLFGRVSHRL